MLIASTARPPLSNLVQDDMPPADERPKESFMGRRAAKFSTRPCHDSIVISVRATMRRRLPGVSACIFLSGKSPCLFAGEFAGGGFFFCERARLI